MDFYDLSQRASSLPKPGTRIPGQVRTTSLPCRWARQYFPHSFIRGFFRTFKSPLHAHTSCRSEGDDKQGFLAESFVVAAAV